MRLRERYRSGSQPGDACGFAVLTLAQAARLTVRDALERISPLLERARAQTDSVQFDAVNTAGQPDTLVQSQEKRFLYFGGA